MQLSNDELDTYIDKITNHIFAILPTYEETGMDDPLLYKIDYVSSEINTLLDNHEFKNINRCICLEALSCVSMLKFLDNHEQIRKTVLKSCSLLSKLKAGG